MNLYKIPHCAVCPTYVVAWSMMEALERLAAENIIPEQIEEVKGYVYLPKEPPADA